MPESEPVPPSPTHDVAAFNGEDSHAAGTSGEAEEALIARWLVPDPDGGGPAGWRVTEQGPEVWALAGYLEEAASPPADGRAPVLRTAAADFHLPLEALRAALAFYLLHRAAIDAVANSNHPPDTWTPIGGPGTPGGSTPARA
jgi:hypothetical protein